ncbi:MAG: toxin-antitoxin system YwqK family antitoxin [Cyclobacteriaceae bacterium]
MKALPVLVLVVLSTGAFAQGFTRQTWHDPERKHLKEVYVVKDTIRNMMHGPYTSYFLNGNIESKGFFNNNETTGIWEFFYESGNLKMRGALRQNTNFGKWEYFYESGQKSMEGTVNGRSREGDWVMYYENGTVKETGSYKNNQRNGVWKSFYEDGVLKSEGDYTDDYGRCTEYYHNGKIAGEGPKAGTRAVGHWRYYAEADGTLHSEGDYVNGKKHGLWITYYPSGRIASQGNYAEGEPSGIWEYYFEDGSLSSSGEFIGGQKNGYWSSQTKDGKKLSEATFANGRGEYREYYPSGKLKVIGLLADNKREGIWNFYYEDGKKEGECDYVNGKGIYRGYYPNGALQTKGELNDDLRVGTWEIYEPDGTLTGYYKPFYDQKKLTNEIVALSQRKTTAKKANRFTYFDERTNEFRGVIIGGNPMFMFAGQFPLAVEFYSQERLGHEFEFIGIRDPFFIADAKIATNKLFERGYSMAIRQKFYNPIKAGMWYFGHEIRFTNLGHFINQEVVPGSIVTFSSSEQRIQYGIVLGYRVMQRNNAGGFTLDIFLAGDLGYRNFDSSPGNEHYFSEVRQNEVVGTLNFGLNLGNIFSQ